MFRSVSLKYLVQVAHLCYLCCLFISKCCSSSGENAFERQIVRWYWFLFYFAFCGSGSRKPQIQSFPLPALHREIKPLPLWVVWYFLIWIFCSASSSCRFTPMCFFGILLLLPFQTFSYILLFPARKKCVMVNFCFMPFLVKSHNPQMLFFKRVKCLEMCLKNKQRKKHTKNPKQTRKSSLPCCSHPKRNLRWGNVDARLQTPCQT